MTDTQTEDHSAAKTLDPPRKSLRHRILTGSFWSLTGSVISQGMAFLAVLVCARFLGKEGFGELGIVRNTVGMFGIFAGMGLGLTATKHVAEFRQSDAAKTGRILRLCTVTALVSSLLMACLLAAVSPLIAKRFLAAPRLAGPLAIGAILLFLYAFDGTQKGALAGFEAYKTIAHVNMVVGILTFPLVVAGVWLGGLKGALAGFVISAALTLAANNHALRRQCTIHQIPVRSDDFWSERNILTGFSLPALLSSGLGMPALWVGNALLVNQPGGYADMGIISATEQIRQFALFVPLTMFGCLLPILSMELNSNEESSARGKLHIINSYSAFFLTTAIVAVLLYLVDPILALYGNDFSNGRYAMIITLCTLPIATYRDGVHRLLQARNMLWYSFMLYLLWAAMFVTGAVFLVRYGATGLTLAYLLAYFWSSVIILPVVFTRLKMERYMKREFTLIFILTLALAPGLLSQVFAASLLLKIGCFILTILLIACAAMVLMTWFRESSRSNTKTA